jgi:hypothetical protein
MRIAAICCLVLISAFAGASTLYVSPIGSDSNSGTIDKPLKSLQRAANLAKPGTTVNIRAGIYCERLRVTSGGTQEGGFITFRSQPGERAILDGSCLTVKKDDDPLVELLNVSFVRVQGLEIRNLRTSDDRAVPWGIRVAGGGSHIEILQNDVHHIQQNFSGPSHSANGLGIGVYGTDAKVPITDLVIDGNQVHHLRTGHSESLVVNGNVSGFRITRNVVHDNNNIGIDVIGFEHKAPDPAVDRARDGVVSENRVYDITSRGNLGQTEPNSDGIYVDGGTRILIERNIVHDVDYGIEMASEHYDGDTSHVIARNNLVYSCHASAFAIGGYDLKRGHTFNVAIISNTIYKNDTWGTGGGEFLMQFYMSNNRFENNIVYVGDHGKLMTSRSGRSEGVPTVVMDHNLYYFPRGPQALTGSFDAKPFAGFEQYLKQTGNDQNSIFGDPQFVAPGADFHLKSDSHARGKAKDLGSDLMGDKDLDGKPRVQGGQIDLGCYQAGTAAAAK